MKEEAISSSGCSPLKKISKFATVMETVDWDQMRNCDKLHTYKCQNVFVAKSISDIASLCIWQIMCDSWFEGKLSMSLT